MNGKGTIIILTNTKAKMDPKGTRKKSGFLFFSPIMTERTVIKPKAITQNMPIPLYSESAFKLKMSISVKINFLNSLLPFLVFFSTFNF